MDTSLSNRYQNLLNRLPEHICLIAVSKTFPIHDIQALYDLGQRHFGENYIQEWQDKCFRLPENIVWHIIGDIQSNKTRVVAENAHWVHTLSRKKIAERLSQQRPENKPPIEVCVEVNISGETQKHGLAVGEVFEFCQYIKTLPQLNLRGLMAVPSDADEQTVRQQMQKMRELFISLNNQGLKLDTLSMGMSSDWQWAVEYGATHIRIGSALFGKRNYAE
ncbi:MAG: YggS family pyridoxal phosphate-dependent enzyme [Neisseriaceae bacterium]|nr:YggS family pyridoxal phosphate-dependent enzyme [Neisseriaceae bacterium]